MNAIITLDDAPEIPRRGKWELRESPNIVSMWKLTNPINVIARELSHRQESRGEVPIQQLIAQYSSDRIALSVWESRRGDQILDTFANSVTEEVTVLSDDDVPALIADNISYHCERYYGDDNLTHCIARLRYDRYYTHIIGSINPNQISVEQFFKLVELVDKRMQTLISEDG